LARAVGPSGRVLALEINDRMLDFLGRQAAEQRLDNVLPRRGQEHDIQVAEGSLDHAFMTQMFVDVEGSHALADRRQLFGSILRALRPGGSFTVCEPPAGQTADTTHEWLVAHLEAYGFCFAARPGPDSPLLRVPILCVRVTRP
jgi:ubiquinone/menaquinone biosynthesis C-methylase UbiE